MKNRFFLTTILCALTILMSGCKKDSIEDLQFSLGSNSAEFNSENNTINAGPERQTITLQVNTDSSTSKWMAHCPTDDVWCSFSKRGGELIVTLDANNTDERRNTHITVGIGSNEERIEVQQDYLRVLNFNLDGNTTTVGAAAALISLPFDTNIKKGLTTKVSAGADWISNVKAENGVLSFSVRKNNSVTDERSATITVSGDGLDVELLIKQLALSGYNYSIDLSDMDFSDCYIYEIWDEVHDIKVGEICREYLYKVIENTGEEVVRMQSAVAYPCLKKQTAVDLQNGYILNNGGKVMWNTAATDGYSIMANYIAGSLTAAPTTIYMPAGASGFTDTYTPEEGDEVFNVVLKPYIFTDTRSGAANNHGETTETWTYKVVKIGTQYWMAENLKTSRYRNGEPIPTNISNADWTIAPDNKWTPGVICHPGCLVAKNTTSSNRILDANLPSAKADRDEYGCLYNWSAIVNSDIPEVVANPSFTDQVSPEGWAIPTRDEIMLMANYVLQGATDPAKDPLAEISATGAGEWANVTGFSAKGTASRGSKTGGFNTGCYYLTMSFYASTSGSAYRYLRVDDAGTNNIQGTQLVGTGVYARCLRK